jgi:hypothetical protein
MPNLLISVEGDVYLRRVDWIGDLPARFGTKVNSGDQIKVATGAKASLFCGDTTLWPDNPKVLSEGYEGGIPCPLSQTLESGPLAPVKIEDYTLVPYILSPRATKILTTTPKLRWHPISGVTTYTVMIRGAGEILWQTEVTTAETQYPKDGPALVPGVPYKLVVEADNGNSSELEKKPDLGFFLLSSKEVSAVQTLRARIEAMGSDAKTTQFLIAILYSSLGLRADAIEVCEQLVSSSVEPAVHRLMADLYLQVQLCFEARKSYQQAIEISAQVEDLEGEAASHYGLGLACWCVGDNDCAVQYLQSALVKFEEIGAKDTVNEIQVLLQDIQ